MSTIKTPVEFTGQFITLRLKTEGPALWPDIHVLSFYSDYVLIPKCPPPHNHAKKFIGNEFDNALLSFTEYFKNNVSGKSIKMSKETPMTYNIKNGLIAVYTDDRISVSKIPFIWEEALKVIGYTRDENLIVPFANGEAYYNKFKDELLAIW